MCLTDGNNRSVMPVNVLGCPRPTLMHSTSLKPCLKKLGNLQCAS